MSTTASKKTPEKKKGVASNIDALIAEHGMSALPWLVLLAATIGGLWHGPAMVILALATGVLIAAIAHLWTSLRAAFGETELSIEDAFALGAPSAEEEQKRAVLRAIKDLEFEHGVGKISDADYKALMTRYRAEAKRLLRTIDEKATPERERVESLVMEHLRAAGIDTPQEDAEEQDAEEQDAEEQDAEEQDAEEQDAGRICPECNTSNDEDAVFCKKCGAKMNDAEEA